MFKVNKFPDGQINVSVSDIESYINIRINSYEDLFVLKSISDVYQYNNWDMPSVFIPCLFGQQSDRRFDNTESFDLKNICEFINLCKFPKVYLLDPHSDVGPALINNCKVVSRDMYVNLSLSELPINTILVSPDAGAYKKTFKLAETLNRELVAANKFRSKTGEINLNFMGDVTDKNCLIVDDLVLGGRTFKELAKALKSNGAREVYLYVTHFKGLKEWDVPNNLLANGIDKIFCTNSVQDLEHADNILQFKVI